MRAWKSGPMVPCTDFPQGESGKSYQAVPTRAGSQDLLSWLAIVRQRAHPQPTVLAPGEWVKGRSPDSEC